MKMRVCLSTESPGVRDILGCWILVSRDASPGGSEEESFAQAFADLAVVFALAMRILGIPRSEADEIIDKVWEDAGIVAARLSSQGPVQ